MIKLKLEERLFWSIQVGHNCNHKYPYMRQAKGCLITDKTMKAEKQRQE